jgi:hypothetical protein
MLPGEGHFDSSLACSLRDASDTKSLQKNSCWTRLLMKSISVHDLVQFDDFV